MTEQTSSSIRPLSFFDAFAYAPAYFPVISALARIDNPLPMPATVHGFRGQSHVRHRAPFAGIPDESRRGLVVLFSHRYPDHMDVQVDVAEVEVHLSELLARIEAGEEITLTRAGRPVATLRPLEPPARRVFGGRPDLKIPDEFFFEPLADEELALWE